MRKKNENLATPFALFVNWHRQALISSLKWLTCTPFTTLMTVIVLGIAMALPTGLLITLYKIKSFSNGLNQSAQISLYLNNQVTQNQVQTLLQQLQQQQNIVSIRYISPDEGLKKFSQQLELGNVLNGLKQNPLPGLIVVHPSLNIQTPAQIHQLFLQLSHLPNVADARIDMAWLKRLYAILQLGERIAEGLAVLLGLGVLFIIGNTINLATQRYRKEIEVYKLAGASDRFVRRPFMYVGLLYGALGGAMAWLFINGMLWWLNPAVQQLAAEYSSQLSLNGLAFSPSIYLIGISMLLGLIGARLTLYNHLKKNYYSST